MIHLKRFLNDDVGATMVEYALMVALIAVVCLAATATLGASVRGMFQDADELLPD